MALGHHLIGWLLQQQPKLGPCTLPCRGRLAWKTLWKPSSLGVPLSSNDAHGLKVHRSSQFGEIRRVAQTCSSRENFVEARATFVKRLEFFFESTFSAALSAYDPLNCPPHASASNNPNTMWFPIVGHPLWQQLRFRRALEVCTEGYDRYLLEQAFAGTIPFSRVRQLDRT